MNFLITGNMKTFSFLITLIFLSCGTDQGEIKTYIYTVRNESGVNVIFKGYKTKIKTPPTIIQLDNNQEITKTFKDGLPPRGPYEFSHLFQSDSLIVLFNNKKKISYLWGSSCESSNARNPLNICFHSRNKIETFIFTIEDYNNAQDCNGNCD